MKFKISKNRRTLTISANAKERRTLRALPRGDAQGCGSVVGMDKTMFEFFEPLTCNSELDWINAEETGDLTDAPMLGIIEYPENTDARTIIARWAFMDYALRSPLEDLRDTGKAVFVGGDL